MSDYLFRGVTQSNHKPSFGAYLEPRYNISPNLQAYLGVAYNTIRFANDANSEIDLYFGLRPTFGKLALDMGFWYYYYPGGTCYAGGAFAGCPLGLANGNFIKKDVSFWEIYFKPTYNFSEFIRCRRNVVLHAVVPQQRRTRHLSVGHGQVHIPGSEERRGVLYVG